MEKKVMMTGEKESFLIRVLMTKLKGAGMICEFVPWDVNEINQHWAGTKLITLYIADGESVPDKALRFLIDKMEEEEIQMIPIGEMGDMHILTEKVPGNCIYQSMTRPVNNEEFVKCVQGYFAMMDAGEFKKNILVVDDDPTYLALVRDWLRGSYKVSIVNSGMQALRWLSNNKVDLILLDHEMPVTSGPQVLEMLRSDEDTKDIPVMFLTGKGDKESVMAVLSLKPEGYFLKNITKKELLEKLDEFFTLHKQA